MRILYRNAPSRRHGFTLIELLTVIAIIAILMALLFPVMSTVRENARKSQCMSNMKDIVQAMKMYKDDHRVYPDALYGLRYTAPAGRPFETRLYPEYVKDRNNFSCPNSIVKMTPTDTTFFPATHTGLGAATNYELANWSSYDFQHRPNTATPLARELHYSLKWTGVPNSSGDNPRQLVYKNPPDDTVVTWCLYHAGTMDAAGNPPSSGMTLVAFLNGRVQTIPYNRLPVWSATAGPWTAQPKP